MKPQVKIWIAEHDPQDLEVDLYELTTGGLDYTSMVVQNEKEFYRSARYFYTRPDCRIILFLLAGPSCWK